MTTTLQEINKLKEEIEKLKQENEGLKTQLIKVPRKSMNYRYMKNLEEENKKLKENQMGENEQIALQLTLDNADDFEDWINESGWCCRNDNGELEHLGHHNSITVDLCDL